MAHLISSYGRDEMGEIAIDEWMGASPIYTRPHAEAARVRGRRHLDTIFKGLQLDIGAPPQFMDFRYRCIDDQHGEF